MAEPTTRSPRPLTVIQSDIAVTKLGRSACQAAVDALLAQRRQLLSAGWPTNHPLCEDLDKDAERWAAHAEQMRRSLLDLREELNPSEPAHQTNSGPGAASTAPGLTTTPRRP